MTANEKTYDEPGMVRPARQVLLGAGLLVGGCVLFGALVVAGANVLSAVGLVLAVSGLALLVSGFVQARRSSGRGGITEQGSGSSGRGVLALVLAFVVPPAGLLLAAYGPVHQGSRRGVETAAVGVGAVLTVLYTFGIVLAAGQAASPS